MTRSQARTERAKRRVPCLQAARGINGFTRESKVQYYRKTVVDLIHWLLPCGPTAGAVWQDTTGATSVEVAR
jgi:hypothetical protein